MNMPEQIRKQAKEVQDLYDQLAADDKPEQTAAPTEGEQLSLDLDNPNQPSESEKGPKAGEGQPSGTDDFEQKYRTLQGMFNAQVPPLQRQVRELADRNQKLEQLLSSMAEPSVPATKQAPTPDEKLVTQEDVDEYGESIDVMRRVSREETNRLLQRIAQLESKLQQVQTNVVPEVQNLSRAYTQSAEQAFWSSLNQQLPAWREVNENQDFQTWLLQPDQFTGITRQTLLEDAQKHGDVGRVMSFFKTWMTEAGFKGAQAKDGKPSELERQVAPGRGRSRGSNAGYGGGEKREYAAADIKAFFDDVRKGRYKGREEERNRIEQDIFAAQKEGRITA